MQLMCTPLVCGKAMFVLCHGYHSRVPCTNADIPFMILFALQMIHLILLKEVGKKVLEILSKQNVP